MAEDPDRFPAPTYAATVLAPLFDATKTAFWDELMRINRAHGVMLAEQGICTADEIGAILAALDEIEAAVQPADLSYDGEIEDVFFFVERELIQRLGVDLAGKLHTGRSRNDIDHTVFKMKLKARLDELLGGLAALLDTLHDVATRHRETIIVAYTHGQPAQPSTLGHYLGAVIEVLLRDSERLRQARAQADRSSMGAAAITTTGFGIDRERMADLLGFAAVQENSYGCIAACDYVTGVYSALKVMFVNLGRFVQDLNQWTGFEVGQLAVPDAYVQISSIMPQKRNPVPVEHMRLIASLGAGHCDTIVNTMHNTPFTDMNDSEGEVQVAGYQAFDAAGRLLSLLGGFIAAVRVNDAKVRAHIDATCITITELADTLVRTEAISFRQAHEVAAALSREIVAGGETLSSVPYARFVAAFTDALGRAPSLDEPGFRRAASPEHFVAVRERLGGPGPRVLATSLDGYRRAINELRADLATAHEQDALARVALEARVRHYTAQPVEA